MHAYESIRAQSSLFAPNLSAPLFPKGWRPWCLFPGRQARSLHNSHHKSCANEKLCGLVPNYNHQLSCQRELLASIVSLLDFGPWWAAIRHERVTWAEPGRSPLHNWAQRALVLDGVSQVCALPIALQGGSWEWRGKGGGELHGLGTTSHLSTHLHLLAFRFCGLHHSEDKKVLPST